MRTRRLAVAVLAAGVVLTPVLTACTGSQGGSVVAANANGNGIENKSGTEILKAAEAAAKASTAVHIQGSVNGTQVDLRLSSADSDAKIVQQGQHLELLLVGGQHYVKGDSAFWTSQTSAAVADKIADKWVKLSDSEASQYDMFLSSASFFDSLGSTTSATKGGTSTVDGKPVVLVTDDSDGSKVYVQTVEKPLPIKAEKSGSDGGSLTFGDWNVPITDLTAPSADQVVDLSSLTGG